MPDPVTPAATRKVQAVAMGDGVARVIVETTEYAPRVSTSEFQLNSNAAVFARVPQAGTVLKLIGWQADGGWRYAWFPLQHASPPSPRQLGSFAEAVNSALGWGWDVRAAPLSLPEFFHPLWDSLPVRTDADPK